MPACPQALNQRTPIRIRHTQMPQCQGEVGVCHSPVNPGAPQPSPLLFDGGVHTLLHIHTHTPTPAYTQYPLTHTVAHKGAVYGLFVLVALLVTKL